MIEALLRMTADERVSETDAARLLGIEKGTLRNMRTYRKITGYRFSAGNGSKVSYGVRDLASTIEAQRDEHLR